MKIRYMILANPTWSIRFGEWYCRVFCLSSPVSLSVRRECLVQTTDRTGKAHLLISGFNFIVFFC